MNTEKKKDQYNISFSFLIFHLHCMFSPHLTSLSMSSFHGQIYPMRRALSDIVICGIFAELIFLVEES